MPTVSFLGKVLPYGLKLTFKNLPKHTWHADAIGRDVTLAISILDGVVRADCTTLDLKDHYLPHMHFRAARLARAYVDLAAFAGGHAAWLVFDEFIEPNGTISMLRYPHPHLASLCTTYRLTQDTPADVANLNDICGMVLNDPSVFLALNDLIEALCSPYNAAINCGRVLDGLRKLAVPNIEPKLAWPIFRDILRIDEAYAQKISNTSTGPRHGDRTFTPAQTNQELLERTWTIMDRYLSYRKGGSQPLTEEFPFLCG